MTAHNERKHWFLQPSLEDSFYICGGWQIFNRAADLIGKIREAEVITYRERETGARHLDDVPREELAKGILWVTWQSHVTELSRRLEGFEHVVLYAQNIDFGATAGQITPTAWPIVCLSRYIAADYAIREPWRHLPVLPPVLHPAARNTGSARDIDVLVHKRKNVPYVRNELIDAVASRCNTEVLDRWIDQKEFLGLLGRSKVYLYWNHQFMEGIYEGFGMQPLEAIACGAFPVSNAYGGLGDYLEAPWNSLKIGTWNLDFDVHQILGAVRDHDGANPGEKTAQEQYSEERFYERYASLEASLFDYFDFLDAHGGAPQTFAVKPPPPPLHRRPYEWLYRTSRRAYKRWRGILPR